MYRFLTHLAVVTGVVGTLGCTPSTEDAEDQRRGFHCLSAWDGSHREVVTLVKDSLRDPDSFEHISTRVTPADERGLHTFFMEYRARNGFGGLNVITSTGSYANADQSGTAAGVIDVDACAVLDWTTEDDDVHYTEAGIAFLGIAIENERAKLAAAPGTGATGFEYEMRGDESVPNQIEVFDDWLITEETRANGDVTQTALLPSDVSDLDSTTRLGLSFQCERNTSSSLGDLGPMFLHLAFADNPESSKRFLDGARVRFDDQPIETLDWYSIGAWLNWQQPEGDDLQVDVARDIFIGRMMQHQVLEVRVREEGRPFEEPLDHSVRFHLGNTAALLDKLEFCNLDLPD